MGAAVSTSRGTPLRDKLMQSTKKDIDMMNEILQFMLKNATLADFYSVADPSRCKNYLVAGKDALLALFRQLQVRPVKEGGVLYFQRIDGLKKGMPQELEVKQNDYCLELAFFFIRIFQVFGALTLSVLDVSIPSGEVLDVIQEKRPAGQAYIERLPFFGGGGGGGGRQQYGGALTGPWLITNPNYDVLNRYLSVPAAGAPQNEIKFEYYNSMYIHFDTMYVGSSSAPAIRADFQPVVYYAFRTNAGVSTLYGRLTLERDGPNRLDLRMSDFGPPDIVKGTRTFSQVLNLEPSGRFTARGKELPALIEEIMRAVAPKPPFSVVQFFRDLNYVPATINTSQELRVTGTNISILPNQAGKTPVFIRFRDEVEVKHEGRTSKKTITIDGCSLDIRPQVATTGATTKYAVRINFQGKTVIPRELGEGLTFKEYREGVFTQAGEGSTPIHEKTGETIPMYIQGVFRQILEKREDGTSAGPKVERTKEGYVKPYDSEAISPALRVKKLWEALTADPPIKAFCTARAIQLLSPAALEGAMPEQALSSVCRTSFLHQKTGALPVPGRPLSETASIRAMAGLFVDTIENATPRITDSAKYQEFLRSYKFLFERATGPVPALPVDAKLADIREGAPPFCPRGEDARVVVGRDLIGGLRQKAVALINRQITHTANVTRIIQQLFVKAAGGSAGEIVLHPEVRKKGIPYIDKVAADARNLLLAYYQDCEVTYREGLVLMNANKAALRFEKAGPGAGAS
jgi:hypothetical protein